MKSLRKSYTRKAIGPLTGQDLLRLTNLDASSRDVSIEFGPLAPLTLQPRWTGLTELDLGGNKLTHLISSAVLPLTRMRIWFVGAVRSSQKRRNK